MTPTHAEAGDVGRESREPGSQTAKSSSGLWVYKWFPLLLLARGRRGGSHTAGSPYRNADLLADPREGQLSVVLRMWAMKSGNQV